MIVLRFSLQGEYIVYNVLMESVMCLHLSLQEEDILEHTNGKCHLRTF
jgi:UDP-N-acetylmuramyl tripeptide synthase